MPLLPTYRLQPGRGDRQESRLLQSGKTSKETYDHMWSVLTRGEIWRGEIINRRKDGGEYIESTLISR